jgi:choline dehydrogenase-like flavoprotein
MEKQAEIELTKAWRGDVYDAIVVGSGYSGSVAACRMSIVGVKVRLLEKSRRWKAQDFLTDSWEIRRCLFLWLLLLLKQTTKNKCLITEKT